MQYNGGKHLAGKKIAAVINSLCPDRYVEPFVGAASVTQWVDCPIRRAYDINPYLIAMWQKLQEGWLPPVECSEDEYQCAKLGAVEDHLRAFIGFGCSWGGKWFGGYARDSNGRNRCDASHRSVLRKLERLMDVEFECQDYTALSPTDSVIYCDPPYPNTTMGWMKTGEKFDHDEFWETVRKWSEDNTVLISGYIAPDDIICLADWSDIKVTQNTCKDKEKAARTEKLFALGL